MTVTKRIAVGADHAGYELKEALKAALEKDGYTVTDVGCHSEESCDYPEFGFEVGKLVDSGDCAFGVLCCGSGIGMAIAANRFPMVRALVCSNTDDAQMSRLHNNANVICFGQRFTAVPYAIQLLNTFLKTPFEGERHMTRLQKLSQTPLCS